MSVCLSLTGLPDVICVLQAPVDFEVVHFMKPNSLKSASVVQMLLWQTNRGALLAGLCSSYIPLLRFWAGLGGGMVY